MRLIAFFATLAGLVAVGLAGQRLWQVLDTPLPESGAQIAARQTDEPEPPAPSVRSDGWPALFGNVAVVEPQPPAPPTPPEPPKPPAPPVESLGYALKGVISTEAGQWALLSHPTGEVILRIGDSLVEGITVVGIDASGLWLDNGEDRVLLPIVK